MVLTEEKKVKGRKRHLLTDTTGNVISFEITEANFHDSHAVEHLLKGAVQKDLLPITIWVDGGYRGERVQEVALKYNCSIEVVKRNKLPCFKVIPKRWVVERTNAWIDNFRRLVVSYERTVQSEKAFFCVALIYIFLNRFKK